MGKAKTTTTKKHPKKPHTPTQDYCNHYHTWALTTWNIFNIQLQDAAWAWASSDHITSSSDLSSMRDTTFNTEKSHWTKWKQTQLGSGKCLAPLDWTTDHLWLELRLWGRWPRGGALDDRSLLEGVASGQLALPLGLPLVACPATWQQWISTLLVLRTAVTPTTWQQFLMSSDHSTPPPLAQPYVLLGSTHQTTHRHTQRVTSRIYPSHHTHTVTSRVYPSHHTHTVTSRIHPSHHTHTITSRIHPSHHIHTITSRIHPSDHTHTITSRIHPSDHTHTITSRIHSSDHTHTHTITSRIHPSVRTHTITSRIHPSDHTHTITSRIHPSDHTQTQSLPYSIQ